ncbi:Uncharacterised protein [Legionella spiritensis]|nr:Uncharacterised protein [Legionella spiritensis]
MMLSKKMEKLNLDLLNHYIVSFFIRDKRDKWGISTAYGLKCHSPN